MSIPVFKCADKTLERAFEIATSDILSNVRPYKAGILKESEPCLMAGSSYTTPWTRDSAINTRNAAAFLIPDIAKSTLKSVLAYNGGKVRAGGEYWDAVIWITGAYSYYLASADKDFLAEAYTVAQNTLEYFESTELDREDMLFRGPAVYGDGVAAYPDRYACGESGIMAFTRVKRDECLDTGVGIPMKVLSTNCLYYECYKTVLKMERELGIPETVHYSEMAAALLCAINTRLFDNERGTYRYFNDPAGGCDRQEGMGIALALLYGVASPDRAKSVLDRVQLTDSGIACVFPGYERYATEDGTGYGRHSGTVWPHIEAFFAEAALIHGRSDLFVRELYLLASRAVRDGDFAEIYHPKTGEIYGGRQEQAGMGIIEWESVRRQTWSASGFVRLILRGVCGIDVSAEGLSLSPAPFIAECSLNGLTYRGAVLNITVKQGEKNSILISGEEKAFPFIPERGKEYNVQITLTNNEDKIGGKLHDRCS